MHRLLQVMMRPEREYITQMRSLSVLAYYGSSGATSQEIKNRSATIAAAWSASIALIPGYMDPPD
jgi:hypothetical protein